MTKNDDKQETKNLKFSKEGTFVPNKRKSISGKPIYTQDGLPPLINNNEKFTGITVHFDTPTPPIPDGNGTDKK